MTRNTKPQQPIAEFWKRIDADTVFRQEFFRSVPEQLASGAPIVEFAIRHGYVFTEQELHEAAAKVAGGGELSDAQLEAAAGGIMGPNYSGGSGQGDPRASGSGQGDIRPSGKILLTFAGLRRSIGDIPL